MSRKERQNVRIGIIKELAERKSLSYTQLQRALSTNYLSVKENCDELETYGLVKIKTIEEHPRNGHPSKEVSLTESGQRAKGRLKLKPSF